jgi:gamma-glutamylcyclotransferase (GGCT)/AIG2-like uncharacterized protein YtfP
LDSGNRNLFVYGTLMRGQRYQKMMASAQFVKSCVTKPLYHLVDLGAWPALVFGGMDAVAGELYCVSDALLEALDVFEEVPQVYTRQLVSLDTESAVEAYFLHGHLAAGKNLIRPANWASHCRVGGRNQR